jgi:O-antigen/teichoic acid export membrane protein
LLGDAYAAAVPLLRLLAVAIALQILQYGYADSLTAVGLQHERTRVVVGSILLNVGLNAGLIPPYGARGAVLATIASQLACLALLAWRVRVLERREGPVSEVRR